MRQQTNWIWRWCSRGYGISVTNQQGKLIIVAGLPGSGKTTLARKLQAEQNAIRMCADECMDTLGINLWDSTMRGKIEALQWTLAQELLAMAQTVIIEWGTWSRAERDTLRLRARELGARVELYFLDAAVEELYRRIQARGMEEPPISRSDVEKWSDLIERPTEEEAALFD